MAPERAIRIPVRTVVTVLLVILAGWILIDIVAIARQVLVWILIAAFLALALNPLVELLQRTLFRRRGAAVLVTFLLVLLVLAALGGIFVPTLVNQVNEFVEAVPGYVEDLTRGRGPLGFLQDDYDIVDRVREVVEDNGAAGALGVSGTALAVTKGVLTVVVAVVTIAFLTMFMLLEGPQWVERFYALIPEASQARWRRMGTEVYRTIGGYVTGNLAISVVAGIVSTLVFVLVGLPYAVALGLIVALFDLIPLAGATIAAVIVSTIAFIDSLQNGIIVAIFFLVYQQLENHVLQPLIYGRTVQLSPLAVLIAVLIGGSVAGVLGALGAIPVAGTIQVVLREWLEWRRERLVIGREPVAEQVFPASNT